MPTARGTRSFAACVLGLALALGATGCADTTGDAMRQDLAQLRQDLNATSLSVRRNRGETDAVLGQLDRRLRDESGQSQKLATRLDSMQAEIGRLSNRLDDISQRLDALGRQQAARALPSPQGPAARPAPVPPPAPAAPPGAAALPTPPSPPPPPGPGTPAAPPSAPRSPAEGLSLEQTYQTAYLDFTKGNYLLAITGFREFVRRFPDSDLADNAQYWIGESYFSLSRTATGPGQAEKATQALEQAVQEFRKVALNYPQGDKVPTAIYKEGLALLELKQTRAAQARLQYLVDNFPQSEEAPLARERLAILSGNGPERRRDGHSSP